MLKNSKSIIKDEEIESELKNHIEKLHKYNDLKEIG
jgi:predicted small metal-binding protein